MELTEVRAIPGRTTRILTVIIGRSCRILRTISPISWFDQLQFQACSRVCINIPFTRLSLVRDSFPNLAIKLFNRLPASVKVLDATKFESVMKDWLKAGPCTPSMSSLRMI
ncbi:hypothetical protein J6590_023081 [Homalodisca vitripennis]|nr:hypothetical protein J6590_023081 [Homalodisca vitripennis]